MYDPVVGRFLSEDPLGFLSHDANPYRYVGNHPTIAIDPDGMAEEKPPTGTKENGYGGIGEWKFETKEEAMAFFRSMLKPEANNLPPNWETVVQRGCIGLNTIRIGWGDTGMPPIAHFGPGNFTLKNVSFFFSEKAASDFLKAEAAKNKDKEYILFAIQAPLKGGEKPAAVAKKGEGLQPISGADLPANVPFDLTKISDFNVATWFDTGKGTGYWEYIDHQFATRPISSDDPVTCKHVESLPKMGVSWITIYGVTYRRPFNKK